MLHSFTFRRIIYNSIPSVFIYRTESETYSRGDNLTSRWCVWNRLKSLRFVDCRIAKVLPSRLSYSKLISSQPSFWHFFRMKLNFAVGTRVDTNLYDDNAITTTHFNWNPPGLAAMLSPLSLRSDYKLRTHLYLHGNHRGKQITKMPYHLETRSWLSRARRKHMKVINDYEYSQNEKLIWNGKAFCCVPSKFITVSVLGMNESEPATSHLINANDWNFN